MTVKVVDLVCILHNCYYFNHPPYGDIFSDLGDFMHVLGNRLCIFGQHYTLVVFYLPTILINLYSIYEGVSKIFRTGATIYTSVMVAQSISKW
jgi:hypothetical protein